MKHPIEFKIYLTSTRLYKMCLEMGDSQVDVLGILMLSCIGVLHVFDSCSRLVNFIMNKFV